MTISTSIHVFMRHAQVPLVTAPVEIIFANGKTTSTRGRNFSAASELDLTLSIVAVKISKCRQAPSTLLDCCFSVLSSCFPKRPGLRHQRFVCLNFDSGLPQHFAQSLHHLIFSGTLPERLDSIHSWLVGYSRRVPFIVSDHHENLPIPPSSISESLLQLIPHVVASI